MRISVTERDGFAFFFPLRVRFAEVDPQQVVFNAHYLMYYDVGLHEFFRAIGCDYVALLNEHDVDLRVAHASVNYFNSHVFDEILEVAVAIAKLGNSSVTFSLATFTKEHQRPSSQGEIVWVVTDPAGSPTRMPAPLREKLANTAAA